MGTVLGPGGWRDETWLCYSGPHGLVGGSCPRSGAALGAWQWGGASLVEEGEGFLAGNTQQRHSSGSVGPLVTEVMGPESHAGEFEF